MFANETLLAPLGGIWEIYMGKLGLQQSNFSSLPKTNLMMTFSFDFLGHSCYSFQSLMTST